MSLSLIVVVFSGVRLRLGRLTPLSTMFQLYHGGQCYWWGKLEYSDKTNDLLQVTDQLYQIIVYTVHLVWAGFELTTLVVIYTGTDCIRSCKFNYHALTTAIRSLTLNNYRYQKLFLLKLTTLLQSHIFRRIYKKNVYCRTQCQILHRKILISF